LVQAAAELGDDFALFGRIDIGQLLDLLPNATGLLRWKAG
jgi:hypothetical protein